MPHNRRGAAPTARRGRLDALRGWVLAGMVLASSALAAAEQGLPAASFALYRPIGPNCCVLRQDSSQDAIGNVEIVLLTQPPQRHAARLLTAPTSLCQSARAATPDLHCQGVRFNETEPSPANAVGIVIADPWQARVEHDVALGYHASDARRVEFRVCSSTEGLWLSGWEGPALHSKRVWQMYLYLGYDLDPSCLQADWQE